MANEDCGHEKVEIRLECQDCGQEFEKREMRRQDFESQMTELPDREAMSLVNANIAAPINLALAANILSDNSVAIASATQTAPINQSI